MSCTFWLLRRKTQQKERRDNNADIRRLSSGRDSVAGRRTDRAVAGKRRRRMAGREHNAAS